MIQITLKGLAKFMTASPAKQRKILRDFKYPNEEGLAMAQFYKEVRDVIRTYHKSGREKDWLLDKAKEVRQMAVIAPKGGTARRLSHNARAIEQYAEGFAEREFEILSDLDVSITGEAIKVKINPELHVREGGKEKLVKLEFTREAPESALTKIVCQTMYEGALSKSKAFTPSCVLYLDVPRGIEYRGARQGSRMKAEIDAACKNIVSMWPSI